MFYSWGLHSRQGVWHSSRFSTATTPGNQEADPKPAILGEAKQQRPPIRNKSSIMLCLQPCTPSEVKTLTSRGTKSKNAVYCWMNKYEFGSIG
eukprot:6010423-Heterocapsa_arctica.AAC.1